MDIKLESYNHTFVNFFKGHLTNSFSDSDILPEDIQVFDIEVNVSFLSRIISNTWCFFSE